MQVIAFASQKGGSGKTTLAGHVAVEAERAGAGQVAMVDADPQGSLAAWWNEREAATPVFMSTTVERLAENMAKLRSLGSDLLIIDTPPAITSTIAEVVKVADMIVIPTRPSPHDLRAAGATVDLVEHLGKPLVFVVNAAHHRARITNEAVIALSQHGTLAPSIIHQRTIYAVSMIDGRTAFELDKHSRAVPEIETLWTYLRGRLERIASRSVPLTASALRVPTEAFGVIGATAR